jgi:hypothetical protein
MVQPGSGGFSQVDREELDYEQIIICPSHSTCKVVIFQLNAGVDFAVVFGDVAWSLKMLQKCVLRMVPPNALGPNPSGLMLHPSRSSWPPRHGFRARG